MSKTQNEELAELSARDDRVRKILTSPYTRNNPDWAVRLACFTDLTYEQVVMLITIPPGHRSPDITKSGAVILETQR